MHFAALPPHTAVRLCLTGIETTKYEEAAPPIRGVASVLVCASVGRAKPFRNVRRHSRSRRRIIQNAPNCYFLVYRIKRNLLCTAPRHSILAARLEVTSGGQRCC